MSTRPRNDSGQFEAKSDEPRRVRSIRLTDSTWDNLGKLADERSITRADLVEGWMSQNYVLPGNQVNSEVIELLEEALTLKANAGGAIKQKIREVLELLN